MEGNFKRYVDQRTQNVIAPGSKFSYRSVKIEKSRRVVERVRCVTALKAHIQSHNIPNTVYSSHRIVKNVKYLRAKHRQYAT
jgi:hypothetical protein